MLDGKHFKHHNLLWVKIKCLLRNVLIRLKNLASTVWIDIADLDYHFKNVLYLALAQYYRILYMFH